MGLFRWRKEPAKREPEPRLHVERAAIAELVRYSRANCVAVSVEISASGNVVLMSHPLNPDAGQLIRRTGFWVRDLGAPPAVIDSTGKARIWSRNRLPFETKFPMVRDVVNKLRLRSTILDGEIE
jgi:hypothetical protein